MTYVDRTLVTAPAPSLVIPPASGAEHLPGFASAASGPSAHPDLAPLLSVLFLMIDEVHSVVVNVTSAHAGAGTSTVARKMAEAAAAAGWCRVALLDAKPGAGAPGDGLVDLVERGSVPTLAPQAGPFSIDTGRLTSGGQPLSRIDSVRKLYGTLRDRYSLVIVDCPAVLAGQQTLTVAAAADETVLVVEAERTALTDVARARSALERRGAGVLGMVMNKSRPRVPALFGRLS